jgi:predicted exporter
LSLEFSRALGTTGSFDRVANGAGVVTPDGFEYLFENRYLLGPSWNSDEEFSSAFIADSLHRNLALLSTSPGQLLRRYLPADPTGRGRAILAALSPASRPASQGGVWVSRDGSRALIVARARTENFDLDRQAALLGEVRRIFAQLPGAGGHELLIAGPPDFAVATRDRIQTDVQFLSGVSFLLILLLAWGGFRRPMLLLLLGLPMGIGVLAGLAAVQAVFGFVHGITLAFGACLVGIAIDYPLHVLAHAARDGDTAQSARAIWPTLRLSAITTVAAFVPFMLADFPGLAQIGLFVAAGLVAAVLSGRFLFPLLCPTVSHFPLSDRVVARLRRLAAKLRLPLILLPIAALAVLALRWEAVWETDLRALSPIPRDMVALDRELRSGLGAPDVRYLIAVRGESTEEVLVRQEELRSLLRTLSAGEQISSWRMAADLLPSVAEQRRRQAALPASDNLRRRLADAVAGTAFRSNAFDCAAGLPMRLRVLLSGATPSIRSWPTWSACAPRRPLHSIRWRRARPAIWSNPGSALGREALQGLLCFRVWAIPVSWPPRSPRRLFPERISSISSMKPNGWFSRSSIPASYGCWFRSLRFR